ALRRCVNVPPAEFADRYWGREPLLSTGSGDRFADLFGLDAVDELISRRGLRTPFLRIAQDGKVLDAARFTGSGGAGAEIADPLRGQPWGDRSAAVAAQAATTPHIEATLNPGDRLYLPRGWLHSADALGEVSVHLTVGVHPVTRYAVVEALAALAAEAPAL